VGAKAKEPLCQCFLYRFVFISSLLIQKIFSEKLVL